MNRAKKSIILEYLYYGYDPKEISDIEGIKLITVESTISKERGLYVIKLSRKSKKNYFERLKLCFSEDEMDYGFDIPTYTWEDLNYNEQQLINKPEHKKFVNKDYSVRNKQVRNIENLVCSELGIERKQMKSKSMKGDIPLSRFMVWLLVKRNNLFVSREEFSTYFEKSKSSIIYGLKTISTIMEVDKDLRRKYINVLKQL